MLARALFSAALLALASPALARAQPPTPDARGALTVVVESAHATLTPDAIRQALGRALDAPALPLGASDARPRAFVSVVVRSDASASFAVRTVASGVDGASAVTAPGSGVDPVGHVVNELAALVRTVEGRATSPTSVRAGLIPWETDELRPYPDRRVGSVSQDALLPWPARAIGGSADRADLLGAPEPGREAARWDDDEVF